MGGLPDGQVRADGANAPRGKALAGGTAPAYVQRHGKIPHHIIQTVEQQVSCNVQDRHNAVLRVGCAVPVLPDGFAVKNNRCIHKGRCARIHAFCQAARHDKPVFALDMEGMGRRLCSLGQAALAALYPPVCMHCGADVARHGLVCSDCFTHLRLVGAPFCKACAVPQGNSALLGADGLCPVCERHHPAWGQARAAFVYETVARELILKLKYADQMDNATFLAQHMVRIGRDILVADALVVPVPVHRWRLFNRRYNQAALLAQKVARQSGLTCQPDALVRVRRTVPLASFSRHARWDEMEQAITVRRSCAHIVRGRDVVVVDDLLTTGATAAACTKALLHAGVRSVSLLVAGVVPPRPDMDIDQPG